MIHNYEYFIALAEELNISKAAKRLYVSHQCLSRYLKTLEQAYHVTFFERTPQLSLTPAGEAYLEMIRQAKFLESNFENKLQDIRLSKKGTIRFGTTEGRYRILIPDLLSGFRLLYPDVKLEVQYSTSSQLLERVLKNELDLVLLNKQVGSQKQLDVRSVISESLYVVISDHMLAQYFPDQYPQCKHDFLSGVNLADFQEIPFILNKRGFNSREILERHLLAKNIHLNCVMELTQQDLHFLMAAKDYAAAFCWAMYLPTILQNNQVPHAGHLNIFPIRGLVGKNDLALITMKGKILPEYGKALIHLIKQNCSAFSSMAPGNL